MAADPVGVREHVNAYGHCNSPSSLAGGPRDGWDLDRDPASGARGFAPGSRAPAAILHSTSHVRIGPGTGEAMSDQEKESRQQPHASWKTPELPADFVHRGVTLLVLALLGILLVAVTWLAAHVFLIVFAGILLGVFLRALGDFVARHTPLSEGWGLGLVILLLLGLFAGGMILVVPQLIEQIDEFGERVPEIAAQVQAYLERFGWGQRVIEMVEEGGGGDGAGIASGLAGFLGALANAATYLVAFLFIGLFLAINPSLYADGLVRMFPMDRRERARSVMAEVGYILRWFLVARVIAMALVGISTGVALWLLDVPLALLLGVVAGLLTFIPYLGPVIAAIPILMVSLLAGVTTALWVLVVYTAIQQIEGNIFDPLILQRIIHLPPAVTVTSQILGSALLGALGLALATPFAAVMQVIVRRVYREDVLGERREEMEHES